MCVHYKVQSRLTNMMDTSHQHSNRSNSKIKVHQTAVCLVSVL